MAKKAKQEALPTMEDRAIQALEECAEEYADIRDQRIALNTSEADLKKRVRSLMHQHKKTHYARNGIEIELTPPDGEEGVRVRVKKAQAELPTEPGMPDVANIVLARVRLSMLRRRSTPWLAAASMYDVSPP